MEHFNETDFSSEEKGVAEMRGAEQLKITEILEEVCQKTRTNKEDIILHIAPNDDFRSLGIHCGDVLVVDKKEAVNMGNLTIVKRGEDAQAVWLLGNDLMGNPIVSDKYLNYPVLRILPRQTHFEGRVVACLGAEKTKIL